jgi:ArsR family transcriptional regulator
LTKRTAWTDNENILVYAYKLMSMQENSRGDIIEQAAIFNALADPTRLRLVRLLCRQHDPDALCVNALAAFLGVTQSAVSQHIRVLKSAGLVKGLRRGYHIHYFINQDTLERWREEILETLTIEEQNPAGESCSKYCHRKAKQESKSRT